MLVVGGHDGAKHLNDFYQLNLTPQNGAWSRSPTRLHHRPHETPTQPSSLAIPCIYSEAAPEAPETTFILSALPRTSGMRSVRHQARREQFLAHVSATRARYIITRCTSLVVMMGNSDSMISGSSGW